MEKIIFSELAIYAKAESIKYTVLNGYDPITEKIGRDLDVHIPSSFDATKCFLILENCLNCMALSG